MRDVYTEGGSHESPLIRLLLGKDREREAGSERGTVKSPRDVLMLMDDVSGDVIQLLL